MFESSLNYISNTTNDTPDRLMKIKLRMKNDNQRITEIDYAFGIKTSELLQL